MMSASKQVELVGTAQRLIAGITDATQNGTRQAVARRVSST
jgi:hypothetical protein